MTATLIARDITAGHGDRVLFSGLDLVVAPGDVIGLVGANGAGKSTLLRILAGEQRPESGDVRLSPPDALVGYLPQVVDRDPEETVAAFLGRRTGVTSAAATLDDTAQALAEAHDDEVVADAYAAALDRWLALGGADLDVRMEQVADDLGLDVALDHPMTGLSGGQAARVNLAALLLSRFDVFLLDEPTNDLDIAGLERLERFIADLRGGAVLVSHDREFLARTVTRVVELDLAQQQVSTYGGGYEAYLAEREVARRHAREAYEEYSGTLGGLQDRARTQRAWMDKGVRNAVRKQKDPDKHVKAHAKGSAEKQAAKAKQTDRMIERLDVVEEPRKEWDLRMEIAAAPRSGAVVAALNDVVVHRGDFTLGPISVQVDWGDRISVTGRNGSGKTTLLSALLGRVAPDSGAGHLGPGVRVGEIDQARPAFDSAASLQDAFGVAMPEWDAAAIRTLLAKFGLKADHVPRPAESLSPGERTRAALALLQARGVNLLVLDEPTNHLDLAAIEQLESALDTFAGTLVLVTHDRRMLDAVRTHRRWHLADGRLTED